MLWAAFALLSFDQAFAQSSHDAVGREPYVSESGDYEFSMGTTDGKYRMRVNGLLQQNNSFTYRPKEESKNIDVEIKRARLGISGNVFDPRLTYLFNVGLENRDTTDKGQVRVGEQHRAPGTDFLSDYYFNFACNERYLHVRVGKFSTPFSRQNLMSSSKAQFYDNSEAGKSFQLTHSGRDVGIMLHNTHAHPIEWAFAAVSNGLVARIGYNHSGMDAYEASDFTGGDLRFAVGASGFYHTQYHSSKNSDLRGSADFIIKVKGFSTNGAFYYQFAKAEKQKEGANGLGANADFGYVINKKFEPVARYSWAKSGIEGSLHMHEILAGLNYYIYGQHLKVQGYAGTELAGADIFKWIGGVQFQFAL
jgi:hypothetical protein